MADGIEQQVQQTFKYLQDATCANYLGFELVTGRETIASSASNRYKMSQGNALGADYDAAQAGLLSQLKTSLSPVSYEDSERSVMLMPVAVENVLLAYLMLGWDKPCPLIDMETTKLFIDALSISLHGILA